MDMTLLEKKLHIINKIEESISEKFISKIYDEVNEEELWDETEEGKDLILRLLEKSQEQARNGEVISFDDAMAKIKNKFALK
jgi:hypothetical protein